MTTHQSRSFVLMLVFSGQAKPWLRFNDCELSVEFSHSHCLRNKRTKTEGRYRKKIGRELLGAFTDIHSESAEAMFSMN